MRLRSYDRLLVMLSAVGLAIAGYLTLLHYDSSVPLVCSGGSLVNCEQVLTTASSVVFGVPVAAWGLLWFAVSLALAILSSRSRGHVESPAWRSASLAWASIGTLSVFWLVYQELGVIGRICAWCTAVHVLVLALLVIQVSSAPIRGADPAEHS